MPFIKFDSNGVCNYCLNYDKKNKPRNILELKKIVKNLKMIKIMIVLFHFLEEEIVLGLHLIVKELN